MSSDFQEEKYLIPKKEYKSSNNKKKKQQRERRVILHERIPNRAAIDELLAEDSQEEISPNKAEENSAEDNSAEDNSLCKKTDDSDVTTKVSKEDAENLNETRIETLEDSIEVSISQPTDPHDVLQEISTVRSFILQIRNLFS